jgi:hypothetical protein
MLVAAEFFYFKLSNECHLYYFIAIYNINFPFHIKKMAAKAQENSFSFLLHGDLVGGQKNQKCHI